MRRPDLLDRYARLTAAERRLVCRAAALLAVARLTLDWPGPGPALRWWRRGLRPAASLSAPTPARVAWLVEAVAARLPFTTTCLARAAVGARLVAATGQSCALVVGVDPSGRALAAHAWIEVDEAVAGPVPAPRYRPVVHWLLPAPPSA